MAFKFSRWNFFNGLFVKLDDELIESRTGNRLLGVIIDENFSWVFQINQVSKTLARFLPLIYMCRNYLTLYVSKHIHESLVNPNLPYCIKSLGD